MCYGPKVDDQRSILLILHDLKAPQDLKTSGVFPYAIHPDIGSSNPPHGVDIDETWMGFEMVIGF